MRNDSLLLQRLEEALLYLYSLDDKLKPMLSKLTDILTNSINEEQISVKDAFEMWITIQEQYTNSIMLMTKIKEIIDYREL